MLSINTNIPSLVAQRSLNNSTKLLNQAIERMTTGFKINHASDNAANYSISTNMSTKISSYQVAEDNVASGLDLLSTAGGSLDLISDKLTRLRALAEQSSNGTYGKKSILALNNEASVLVNEIYRIKNTAQFNGISLFGKNSIDDGTIGASGLEINNAGFLQDVQRRDVSSMTSMSEVDETQILAKGIYSISTAEELFKLATMQNAGKITNGSEFVLGSDIDLSSYSSGKGWTPIGVFKNQFSGTFDGNGYTVSNLHISLNNDISLGLIGWANDSVIKNLGIESGSISQTGPGNIGGVVGALVGTSGGIYNCFSNVDIDVTATNVGGLAGTSTTTVEYCYATGTVSGDRHVGGLIGQSVDQGYVSNCFATGDVYATGNGDGGLIGLSKKKIANCFATGNVYVDNISNGAGGLLGWSSGDISNSHATGNVSGVVEYGISALVGTMDGTISNCYATGDVLGKATRNYGCGGIVGATEKNSESSIIDSCYIGNIELEGSVIGGIIGRANGKDKIVNCYSTGNITGNNYVGGLLGDTISSVSIENSYSTGNVTGNNYVGGLLGYTTSSVSMCNCYSAGTISATGDYSGGLIAYSSNSASSLSDCYVIGKSCNIKGVLGGYINGNVTNCGYNSYYETLGMDMISKGNAVLTECKPCNSTVPFSYDKYSLTLQCGINSNSSSSMTFDLGFNLGNLKNILYKGIENKNAFGMIDSMLDKVSSKQTEYGAAENRLESALEEISTQYDNLVSSRSTLRDADIAEVSSDYIRQQILQQASATLMATANQSPSLALQLL